MDRRFERRRAADNRLIAMVERLDPDKWFRATGARIIAWPLAERALLQRFAGDDLALDHDLGAGGKMQPGHRAFDYVDGLADQAARPIVLVDSVGYRLRRGDVQKRMLSERHCYRKRLAGF